MYFLIFTMLLSSPAFADVTIDTPTGTPYQRELQREDQLRAIQTDNTFNELFREQETHRLEERVHDLEKARQEPY